MDSVQRKMLFSGRSCGHVIHVKRVKFCSACVCFIRSILSFSLKKQTAGKKNTSHLAHTPLPHPHLTPLSLLQEVVARVLNDGTDIVLQRGPASCQWQALFTDCRVPGAGRETFPFPWTHSGGGAPAAN